MKKNIENIHKISVINEDCLKPFDNISLSPSRKKTLNRNNLKSRKELEGIISPFKINNQIKQTD